jgi:parallel beta-helix repeat protein
MKFVSSLVVCLFIHAISVAQPDIQKKIQRMLIEVENGATITLPAGIFQLDVSLWLDGKEHVTIKGAGMDKTILDFKNQLSGAEGIKVTNSTGIVIRDISVQNTKGDGIKTQLVSNISFINAKVAWTGGANEKNGGYGIYPVQCANVLIDSCVATGASDAGIYVGQSQNIVVRNSRAFENVAGIEIENSLHADVHDNEAYNNTGGILVFDLPDLIVKKGGHVRVFRNHVHHNNHINFAPKGNIVGKVPLGTGIMILATKDVEIFENEIIDNITAGTAIISYYLTENPINDSTYHPFPSNISIHHNVYKRPPVRATSKGRMGKMFRFKLRFGKDVPHILFDGIEDPQTSNRRICIVENENTSFVNIDAAGNFKNISRDMRPFMCSGVSLNPVVLNQE